MIEATDVFVSPAVAHSDFPKVAPCGSTAEKSVSGHAFIASLTVDPLLVDPNGVLQGYVEIPATGGSDTQHVADLPSGPRATS
ncbi:MAG TPA: hypothetical protein VMZ51_06040 [Acidimicrobiales bacterium]|nr:hypothetical protein [Acidimicrobiales bacterium]